MVGEFIYQNFRGEYKRYKLITQHQHCGQTVLNEWVIYRSVFKSISQIERPRGKNKYRKDLEISSSLWDLLFLIIQKR